jgi:predicted ester cyclase
MTPRPATVEMARVGYGRAMSEVDLEARVRGMFDEVFARHEPGAFADYAQPDFVMRIAGLSEPLNGPEGFISWATEYQRAFPDMVVTIERVVVDGSDVFLKWHSVQTHLGEYRNMKPTGRQASIEALELLRFRGDRVAEGWLMFDPLRVMQQLGVLPEGVPPRPVVGLLKLLTRLSRLAPSK